MWLSYCVAYSFGLVVRLQTKPTVNHCIITNNNHRVMMGMWVWPSGMYMAVTALATCSLQNLLLIEDLQA